MKHNPKVVSFNRSSAYAHHRAMVNRRENNPVDALELMRHAVERAPDNREYRLDLAELYCEMGCHRQSSKLLLDMLGDLVVGGLTKLYRRLYDEALVNPEFSGDFIAVRGACTVAFTGESDTPRQVVDLLQEEIERMRREGVDPEVFMLVKNQMYGELLGDVEAVDDAAEEAAAACLKGRTLADEIAALAALTVEDANALLQTALREENRAYVQIDPAEK